MGNTSKRGEGKILSGGINVTIGTQRVNYRYRAKCREIKIANTKMIICSLRNTQKQKIQLSLCNIYFKNI